MIRHKCAFESICALADELSDAQKESVQGKLWGPVLEYKKFVIDRHMVQALIHA